MTLTDAGPLIALIDAGEPDHELCTGVLADLQLPLLTTWPAFTEAMYLLGRAGGWPGQQALWRLALREDLVIADASPDSNRRASQLMRRYADRPMDLADATLVVLAEDRELTTIFTLDADFHIYRLKGRKQFEVIPA
jgi:predicted nucleic acid-binding protein